MIIQGWRGQSIYDLSSCLAIESGIQNLNQYNLFDDHHIINMETKILRKLAKAFKKFVEILDKLREIIFRKLKNCKKFH